MSDAKTEQDAPSPQDPPEDPPEGASEEAAEDPASEPKPKPGPASPAPEPKELTSPFSAPFARNWPPDPELIELMAAFDRGDYASVRANAPKLAERTQDQRVKAAALDLRRRIDPDPVSGILVLVAMGLLIVLAAHYLGHRQPADAPEPRPLRPVPRSTAP